MLGARLLETSSAAAGSSILPMTMILNYSQTRIAIPMTPSVPLLWLTHCCIMMVILASTSMTGAANTHIRWAAMVAVSPNG